MSRASKGPIRAAGCLVWRYGNDGPEVLLVHRPRYDDWSFPKGKVDRGEHLFTTAVREVWEETGLEVHLGPRLPDQHYDVNGRDKVVSYWAAEADPRADISRYEPNDEVDKLRWVSVKRARKQLTYPYDVELLEPFLDCGLETSPLLVVRHTQARKRGGWHDDDWERPLRADGRREAQCKVTRLLRAYGVDKVLTSDAARCVETVLPYVNEADVPMKLKRGLSEEEHTRKKIGTIMGKALASDRRIAVCSHRPVLGKVFAALGLPELGLPPGGVVVVHRAGGRVVDLEQYD